MLSIPETTCFGGPIPGMGGSSCLHTSEHNEVAERKHCSIVDTHALSALFLDSSGQRSS